MTKKAILFDLDGTLTDSGEGIMNCATVALEHFGIPVPERKKLHVFVGPPLDQTFTDFGVPKDRIQEAIDVFRKRYTTIGKFENFPYPGISELLQALKDQGHRLFVATSKPEILALEIMEKFELSPFFEKICGATLDSSRATKEDVIAYLLAQVGTIENTVMVGDTVYDVRGAAVHHIPTIGVSWGYGITEQMISAGAKAIAHTTDELYQLLQE